MRGGNRPHPGSDDHPERLREAHQRGLERYLQTGETRVLNRRIELPAVDREQREFPVEIAITAMRRCHAAGTVHHLRGSGYPGAG